MTANDIQDVTPGSDSVTPDVTEGVTPECNSVTADVTPETIVERAKKLWDNVPYPDLRRYLRNDITLEELSPSKTLEVELYLIAEKLRNLSREALTRYCSFQFHEIGVLVNYWHQKIAGRTGS